MPFRESMVRIVSRRLLRTGLVVVVSCSALPAQAVITANVSVDAANVRAKMSPLGLGLHTSPYYNNMSHSSADDRLEEAGVTTLRYGGGGYADVLHWSIARPSWENGITGGGLSPWFGRAGDFGYVGPGSDFASFVRLLDRVDDSHAVVTVNYGSALKLVNSHSVVPDFGGQPKEAAAWVAYANAEASLYGTPDDIEIGIDEQGNDWRTAGYWAKLRGSTQAEYQSWASADGVYEPLNRFLAIDRDVPVGIKYWEIGNETFGTGYYGGGEGYSVDYDVPYNGTNRDDHPDLSPARYGQDIAAYSQLMKSIDPSIKIGAVLATPPDDYGWSYADLNDNGSKNVNEPYWNDEVLENAAGHVDFVMVHWYPHAGNNSNGTNLLAEVRTKLPRMIDGLTTGQDPGANAGLRDTLAAHGVADAEIMVTEFNYFGSLQGSLENAAESVFVADAYTSWLELGVSSVQYLEMLTKDFLDDSASLERGSAFYGISMVDKLARPGDTFIAANSSHNNVRAHAAIQESGEVAIMLLNLDLTNEADITVRLDGVGVESTGIRYTLTGGTNLSQTIESALGNSFTISMPARSITTLVIPMVEGLTGDFNSDGRVDAADYVVWRRALGQEVDPYTGGDSDGNGIVDSTDYAMWAANFGSMQSSATATGGFAVPEPSTALLVVLLSTFRISRPGTGDIEHY